ncbi:glycosyltransferase [Yersinia mollaretii]|uniref:Glycosyltransferase n=1 Tax=Yersinia mollaretii TaxID=33060 RepID=A0AA44CJT9_YERMO|nr:glycosyltransferase family 2 protein [Yersinia mollaretii]NIL21920.1 glycosyltransferase [Yersinia mollaretii]CNI16046.1 glycosyltransferase [Yersinia mollaretii]CQQ21249.1 glycosyltransferase [Yersinia mollaretii]
MGQSFFFQNLKISIITVVFNSASELKETIDSVRSQKYADIEYVVIDGDSKDNTIKIIQANTDIINIWISESDKGIYDAMNKGVKLCSGDYIIFMNAGDTFYDQNSIANAMSQPNIHMYDVIYGDYSVINAYRRNGHRKAKDINELWKGMPTSHQAMFFKRLSNTQVIYNLESGLAADHDLVVRKFLANEKFLRLDSILIANYSGGGISDKKRTDVYRSLYKNSKLLNKNHFQLSSYYGYMFLRTLIRTTILSVSQYFKR